MRRINIGFIGRLHADDKDLFERGGSNFDVQMHRVGGEFDSARFIEVANHELPLPITPLFAAALPLAGRSSDPQAVRASPIAAVDALLESMRLASIRARP